MGDAERGFRIRPPLRTDLDALVAIHGDPVTNQHNPSGPLRGREEGRVMLAAWIDDWRRDGIGYWTVITALDEPGVGSDAVVGFGGVRYLRAGLTQVFNLYYRFSPGSWGHGWATAVARRAVDEAGRLDSGTPVIARMQPGNRPSERVAEKVGLATVGHDRDGRLVLADRPVPDELIAKLPTGVVRPGSST